MLSGGGLEVGTLTLQTRSSLLRIRAKIDIYIYAFALPVYSEQ